MSIQYKKYVSDSNNNKNKLPNYSIDQIITEHKEEENLLILSLDKFTTKQLNDQIEPQHIEEINTYRTSKFLKDEEDLSTKNVNENKNMLIEENEEQIIRSSFRKTRKDDVNLCTSNSYETSFKLSSPSIKENKKRIKDDLARSNKSLNDTSNLDANVKMENVINLCSIEDVSPKIPMPMLKLNLNLPEPSNNTEYSRKMFSPLKMPSDSSPKVKPQILSSLQKNRIMEDNRELKIKLEDVQIENFELKEKYKILSELQEKKQNEYMDILEYLKNENEELKKRIKTYEENETISNLKLNRLESLESSFNQANDMINRLKRDHNNIKYYANSVESTNNELKNIIDSKEDEINNLKISINEIKNNYEVLEIKYIREQESNNLLKDNFEKISNKYNFIASNIKLPVTPVDELELHLNKNKFEIVKERMKKMGIDNNPNTSRNNTMSKYSSSCSNIQSLVNKDRDKLILEKQKWQFELSKIPIKNKSLGEINRKRMIEEKINKLDIEINKIIPVVE